MTIQILKTRTVGELQQDFNQQYPFLRIDVFREVGGRLGSTIKQKLPKTVKLSAAGRIKEGGMNIFDGMTVGYLEKAFRENFGLIVQISRKSGPVWLETTVTDKWTLKQQDDHGRELSTPIKKSVPDENADFDQ